MKLVLTFALTLTLSPGEREQPSCFSGLANGCPGKPVARHFVEAEDDSLSP